MKRLCLECNLEIKSHSNAIRHKACFIKFKAFDKKEYMKKWWEDNRYRMKSYMGKYNVKKSKKCLDCGCSITYNADRCFKCRCKVPELQGKYKDGRCKDKRLYNQLKRALEGGKITIKTIQNVYEENIKFYGTLTCYLCLNPIKFKEDTLEHRIPKSRGGDNSMENLAIACRICNSKKGKKTDKEYLEKEVAY